MTDEVNTMMPAVHARRPEDLNQPKDLESFAAWACNNRAAVEWFLDRAEAIREAIRTGQKALVGDSNDAEHDALYELVQALGVGEVPECFADSGEGECAVALMGTHNADCPCKAWEGEAQPPSETGYSIHATGCPYEHGGACTCS